MRKGVKNIIHKIQQPDYTKLETLALEKVRKYNLEPNTLNEEAVLYQHSKKGGLRKSNKRKNKKKNKKYTKRKTRKTIHKNIKKN